MTRTLVLLVALFAVGCGSVMSDDDLDADNDASTDVENDAEAAEDTESDWAEAETEAAPDDAEDPDEVAADVPLDEGVAEADVEPEADAADVDAVEDDAAIIPDDAVPDDAFEVEDGELDDSADVEDAGPDETIEPCPGGWLDPATNLCWRSGPMADWGDAASYCSDLAAADGLPWRLPTISELRTLVRGCPATETGGACGVTDDCLLGPPSPCYDNCGGGASVCPNLEGPVDGCYWSPEVDAVATCGWYWTSQASDHEGWPWGLGFGNATIFAVPPTGYLEGVLCVHAVEL